MPFGLPFAARFLPPGAGRELPEVPAEPQYPTADIERILTEFYSRPQQPAQPPLGFLDRLAYGLAETPRPGAYGPAGDVFAASLLSGLARGFGGSRVAQREREGAAVQRDFERAQAAAKAQMEARITAAKQTYEDRRKEFSDAARILREARAFKVRRGTPEERAAEVAAEETARRLAARMTPLPGDQPRERLVQVEGPAGESTWALESEAVGKPAAQAQRAVTGQERQALAYYNRAKDASDAIVSGPRGASLEHRIARQALPSQIRGRFAPNLVQTPDQQVYRQAQRAFTEARLRKESGAAIPKHEFENDSRTYFAEPGDSDAAIERKRKARGKVLEGLKFSAGRAYEEFYGAAAAPAGNWFERNAPKAKP